MPKKTLTTWQKATALVPLAILSGAWTASIAVPGSEDVTATSSEAAGTDGGAGSLPDGSSLPTQAIEAPASVSLPDVLGSGGAGSAGAIVASSSANGIPTAALAAYQRSAQVINAADKSCHMPWQLVAAIGRVESDHGRYGGNVLSSKGISEPGIYGIPLDGTNGTAKISDTDGGEFDKDPVWDRAMGPMQFIPSTWSIVGVDSDGDGKRNPQSISDAALATAVYLCSGSDDLGNDGGRSKAVFRYNHSQDYVDLVLAIMHAYMEGDWSAVPNSTYAGSSFSPVPSDQVVTKKTSGSPKKASTVPPRRTPGGATGSTGAVGSTGGSTAGSTGGVTSGVTGGSTSSSGGGAVSGTTDKVTKTVKGTVDNTTGTVQDTVTPLQEATAYCQKQDLSGTTLQACTDAYLKGGASAVGNLLSGLGGTVGGAVGGLTGP